MEVSVAEGIGVRIKMKEKEKHLSSIQTG